MLFSYKFFTWQFNPWQQAPAIKSHNHQNTTTTPPHHHNNNKNQNHRERERERVARSKVRSIVGLECAIWASSRSSDWSVRLSDWSVRSGLPLNRRIVVCDRRTRKRRSGLHRRRRRRDLASSRTRALSLSLSLSLCASVPKMVWSENFHFKPFPWSKAHFPSQLQIISKKYIFHAQPNTRIYGKTFLKVVWSQNKHSLKKKKVTTSKGSQNKWITSTFEIGWLHIVLTISRD